MNLRFVCITICLCHVFECFSPGSDDARAPPFPASAYGNRTSRSPPNASKIPKLDGVVTSPPKGPQDRGRMQTLGSEGLLDDQALQEIFER